MLTTTENMVAEPQAELEALLADYESYVFNGAPAPVGVEPLDGAISAELPTIDPADVMTFPEEPVISVTTPDAPPSTDAPANSVPPTDEAPPPAPATSEAAPAETPATAVMPADGGADPAPPTDTVVVATLGDVVQGGPGENVFEVHGLSPRFEDLARITDFTQGEDLLRFDGDITATPENVAMFTAESYEDARLAAVRLIEGGQADYVAVQIADDVVVFGDNGNDVVDAAVVLAGRRLTDVGMHDFG